MLRRKSYAGSVFSGKEPTILTQYSCCGVSCTGKAVLGAVLVTLLPGARTHEISFPTKGVSCQYKHVCTEGLPPAPRCPAETPLSSPFVVMLSIVWHSAVHGPSLSVTARPLIPAKAIKTCPLIRFPPASVRSTCS